jgi:Pirin C-terminal cupin domain
LPRLFHGPAIADQLPTLAAAVSYAMRGVTGNGVTSTDAISDDVAATKQLLGQADPWRDGRPAATGADRQLRPFVMNTRAEIVTAIEDFQSGRLGRIPADQMAPRDFS